MTGHLIPGAVLLAASVALGMLLAVHGLHDHGWLGRLRARLLGGPPPLVTSHVHWYQNLPAARRHAADAGTVVMAAFLAGLFVPAPWPAAGLAWLAVALAAVMQFRPGRPVPVTSGGSSHVH